MGLVVELLDADPRFVYRSLSDAGVRVRDVTSYHRLESCLRVSVGSEEENTVFLSELTRCVVRGSARSGSDS